MTHLSQVAKLNSTSIFSHLGYFTHIIIRRRGYFRYVCCCSLSLGLVTLWLWRRPRLLIPCSWAYLAVICGSCIWVVCGTISTPVYWCRVRPGGIIVIRNLIILCVSFLYSYSGVISTLIVICKWNTVM